MMFESESTKTRIIAIENVAVESSRRSVYRALAGREDYEVHLVVPEFWRDQTEVVQCEPEEHSRLHVHPTPTIFGYRQHRVLYPALFNIVHKLRPHILYMDMEPENYAALQALFVSRFCSSSTNLVLVSSRTIDHWKFGYPYRLALTHRFCDSIVRIAGADLMFVRPKAAIPNARHYAPTIVHLPHPVDCHMFRRRDADHLPGRERALTIGYLGRLVEGKGIHLLIEAMPSLPIEVRLLVVGSGPLGEHLVELASGLGVSHRVEFRPSVRYWKVPEILNQVDILVLPSLLTRFWNEYFGRVLIEAMACEVPVLASDSAGIPDVVGGAGLLFRTGDLADLIRKLRLLIADPDLRLRYQGLGRRRALSEFDAPVIAERMAQAFDACLRRS